MREAGYESSSQDVENTEALDRTDVRSERRLSAIGACLFATPVSLVFTIWICVKTSVSAWWGLPLYALLGVVIALLFLGLDWLVARARR